MEKIFIKRMFSVVILFLFCGVAVQGDTIVWNDADPGNWNVPSNWIDGILPGISDTAKIQGGAAEVNSDVNEINILYLGGPTGAILDMTSGTLETASHFQVCKYSTSDGGIAEVNQVGGSFIVGGRAYMAGWANSVFTYNMSDGVFNCGTGAYIGDQGASATFNQAGGSVVLDGLMRVGWNNSCYGYYTISGGSLAVQSAQMLIKRGVFKVVGSDADEIYMEGIDLSAGIDAAIAVTLDSGGSTLIDVDMIYATVDLSNAKLIIDVTPDFAGNINDTYDIMHVADGTTFITTGLTIVNANQNNLFSYSVVPDTINGGYFLRLTLDAKGIYAQNPSPEIDSVIGYDSSGGLSWELPEPYEIGGTVLCDVLVSDEAIDPCFTNPQKIVDKQNVEHVSFTFDPNKNYLWRVDCYSILNSIEQKTVGVLWSFDTTQLAVKSLEWNFETTSTANLSYEQAIAGNKITATANSYYTSSSSGAQDIPQNTVNGYGLLGDVHSAQPSGRGMWMTDGNFAPLTCPGCSTEGSAWVKYEFDQSYDLGELWIWNHNQDSGSTDSKLRGIQNATIEYSVDENTYSTLGSYVFNDATHIGGYAHNTEIDFSGINAKYVVITAAMSDGSYGSFYRGLSEVRFGIDNTTQTESSTPDTGGNVNKRGVFNNNPQLVDGYIYDSNHCLYFDDGNDYIYSILPSSTDFPLAGDSQWSMNMYVYLERANGNGVAIGGFGDADDGTDGCKRLIVVKDDCIKFWGDSRDIETSVKWDHAKWQMITATYDGTTVRLYKNGTLIGSAQVDFIDAAGQVHIAARTVAGALVNFEGMVDDFTIYNGVLTQSQIDNLASRLPVAADINRDRNIDYEDLCVFAKDWLQGANSVEVSTPGIIEWTESFEDGAGYQARWQADGNDWTGWAVTTDGGSIPDGSSCLTATEATENMSRQIGSVSGIMQASWYYRIASTTGTGYDYVLIRDASGRSLATFQLNHDDINGYVTCYNTGNETFEFPVGDDYVKITVKIDRSKGKLAWFANDKLVEKDLCLRDSLAGAAAMITVTHRYTDPASYFDLIDISVPTTDIEFSDADISGSDGKPDGIVNFYDFVNIASCWMVTIN